MRIALLSPKGALYRHRGGIFGRSLRYAPLTLTTLAALIPPELEAEVTLHDEGIEEIDPDLKADLVGMTVITGTAPRAYELARRFRSRGIPVVLGGPHVTLVPEDSAPHADTIVTGYAERTWPRLLRDLAAGGMQRRYDQGPDLDLAGLPFPRRDLLPRRRYLTTAVFEASRGCPHDCEFCVVPAAWGRRPLRKPVDEVVEDIRRHGARRIVFVDLNLVGDPDYASRLFEALVPLRVRWFGLATSLIGVDPSLVSLAARSGCRGLLVGFESTDTKSLRGIRKGFNRARDYGAFVERLHRHRIAVQACFVFGLDGDTADVPMQTARRCVEMKIDLPRFAIATPFPGTPMFERLRGEGRILTRNWELFDGQHVVFQPARMSVEALQNETERAWRHVYSAPSMARRLAGTAAPLPLALLANLGYRHYARNLHRFYTCDWPMAGPQRRKTA
jgi:radical SAM superfamily enzyme YgiQ (UPF0313 family)